MFSIRSQDTQVRSQIKSKRQNFRNQIRRQKLHEYKNKIRHKFIFDNEVDANILKKISLTELLSVLLKYEFPHVKYDVRDEVQIDECQVIYDIQREQNIAIFNAIQGLFLYATSSSQSHMVNMLQERHIFILAEILDRKVVQMKPLFKEKSYLQGKKANDLRLPPIYERIAVILVQCAFSDVLFFEDSIRYIVHVINKLLLVFPRHTRIVETCVYMVGACLNNKILVNHLLFLLSDQQSSNCLLTRILDILTHQVEFFDKDSEHSNRTLNSLLYFYEQAFAELIMNDLYPNMIQSIFKMLGKLTFEDLNEKLTMSLAKTLLNLYNPNFGNVSQILLKTETLFDWILTVLHRCVTVLKEKQLKDNIGEKVYLSKNCLSILGTVFEAPDPEDQYFISITQFLAEYYDHKLDILLQNALKISQIPIIHQTLQVIKTICNWGDFLTYVYENGNILIKLFYFCRNQSFAIKKQAILSICNIIEGYFEEKAYHDPELCNMYDHLVEKFDFLDILVENLDSYADVTLNVEILRIVKILCYFWQSDPELGKYNRFWTKFAQNGGQLKLNIILAEDRNQKMKELALEILDRFVVTEEYET